MRTAFLFISVISLVACYGQQPNATAQLASESSTFPGGSFLPLKSREFFLSVNQNQGLAKEELQVSKYIRRIFQDKKGNYWYGTNDEGVCRNDGKDFTYFDVNKGMSGNAVRAICEDAMGNLWFATDGGITRFDGKNFKRYTTKDGLPNDDTWSLLIDRDGQMWAGTLGGLCRFDGNRFNKVQLPAAHRKDPSRFNPLLVWSIAQDRDGQLWFGTDGAGLYRYNGKTFTLFTDLDGLAGNNILSVCPGQLGKIWISVRGKGVCWFDGKTFARLDPKNGPGAEDVWSLTEDRAGRLWLATLGNGVSCYNGVTFTNYLERDGLTRNHVQCIYEDQRGKLWFGFSGGIFKLEGSKLVNFTKPGC